jgi:hypothetical protein
MMKIDGACHCGAIAFEAEVDPARVGMCHCTDCQTLSGSAFRVNVTAAAATFRLLRGEPRTYLKTADSGGLRRHGFCGDCGTPIYSAAPENPTSYGLRLGTIAQRRELSPQRQIWRRSALPWVDALGDVPGVERQ